MKTPDPFLEVTEALRKTARSFYLSLMIFPSTLKKQVSVAYFFCKTADTIVDLDHFLQEDKENILNDFYKVLNGSLPLGGFIPVAEAKRRSKSKEPLFSAVRPALTLLHAFSSEDQKMILEVVQKVIVGMKIDLKGRPPESEKELDQYCYYVAGSAGAFLTDLFYHYRFFKKGREEMISLGIQLGKGLQLTNILRDQVEDRERNRVYLPSGAELSSESVIYPKILSYLENGLKYVTSLPRFSWRIRLASLWPLLFALRTLTRLAKISPKGSIQKIKIRRSEIYLTMLLSGLFIFSNNGIKLYFDSIRRKIRIGGGIKY